MFVWLGLRPLQFSSPKHSLLIVTKTYSSRRHGAAMSLDVKGHLDRRAIFTDGVGVGVEVGVGPKTACITDMSVLQLLHG